MDYLKKLVSILANHSAFSEELQAELKALEMDLNKDWYAAKEGE